MSSNANNPLLITIEILDGKGSEFLKSLFEIDSLRSKGKPISAKLLNSFFDSFTTQRKSREKKINQKVKKLVDELLEKLGADKYNFNVKQFEYLGFTEILPNGKKGSNAKELKEYSLPDVVTKIYIELLKDDNQGRFDKVGAFIKYVNDYFVDYLNKIESKTEVLSKWKIGLLTATIAVQFGFLHDSKNYKELGSGIKYNDYLYEKFRYYTERQRKSKKD